MKVLTKEEFREKVLADQERRKKKKEIELKKRLVLQKRTMLDYYGYTNEQKWLCKIGKRLHKLFKNKSNKKAGSI